jgi:hypothetical protein
MQRPGSGTVRLLRRVLVGNSRSLPSTHWTDRLMRSVRAAKSMPVVLCCSSQCSRPCGGALGDGGVAGVGRRWTSVTPYGMEYEGIKPIRDEVSAGRTIGVEGLGPGVSCRPDGESAGQ